MTNFSTSVNLNDSERSQLLLASQNYGTFYCIYGNFEVKNNKIISIGFEIVNYKGLLNIGFLASDLNEEEKNINKSKIYVINDGNTLYIGVPLKAATCNTNTTVTQNNFIPKGGIDIKKIKKIVVSRGLIKNGLKDQNDILFDSEFHYRDGTDTPLQMIENVRLITDGELRDKIKIEGLFLSEKEWEETISRDKSNLFFSAAASNNCRISEIEVLKEIDEN